MSISIQPKLEARLRERAEAEGLSVETYIESLVRSDERAHSELERLAVEGLNSGESVAPGSEYWEEKHRRLERRLEQKTGTQ